MLSALNRHKNKNKKIRWEETFRGDKYVYGIDCGDGFTDTTYKLVKLYILNI